MRVYDKGMDEDMQAIKTSVNNLLDIHFRSHEDYIYNEGATSDYLDDIADLISSTIIGALDLLESEVKGTAIGVPMIPLKAISEERKRWTR